MNCGAPEFAAEMDYADKSLKSQMKRADKLNSSFTLIFGDKEIEEKQVLVEKHADKRSANDSLWMVCWNQ